MAPPRKKTTPPPDPLSLALGRRVAQLRKERGDLSPQQFAERAGMSTTYLWRIEDGRQNLSFRNVARLAQAFGITLSELLEGVAIPTDVGGTRSYSRGTS